jgi:hypothetical protein
MNETFTNIETSSEIIDRIGATQGGAPKRKRVGQAYDRAWCIVRAPQGSLPRHVDRQAYEARL